MTLKDSEKTTGVSQPISLWDLSAPSTSEEALLEGDIVTDVAIIGGGYTGSSTALHLAEMGIECVVLEAEKIGFGGSGRNCGMVNPGIWLPPQDVRTVLGDESADRFLDVMGRAPDTVFSLIDRFDMKCEATRNGTIHAAHSPTGFKELSARAQEWQRRGREVTLLDADQTQNKIGTPYFYGGLLDPKAGTVNPMGYARELAAAAVSKGAVIYSQTRALNLSQVNGKWQVRTQRGTVTANQVVIGGNAYNDDLWPGLKQAYTPIHFYQVATKPLGKIADKILPGAQSVWDTGLVMFSVRKDQFGRLIVGSMGKLAGKDNSQSEYWAQKRINQMFPFLGKVEFEKAWHGKIAMTPDHLPRIHILAPGLYTAVGFNGRGITTGTVCGEAMAQLLTGAPEKNIMLPVTGLIKDRAAFIREPTYEACFKAWRYYKSI
ncbi:FAD-binding oxidoreductase [Marinomonas sp. A79]|uniref:FAD-binding oxidoreductase n=1 Tax=Marinomonas vulgaris TaxID=2823372 RepID=A0ABS5HBD7_9GAMM|nr:FAD-binding oxidoreductase [Marinomonas vulgaris]MBR7888767.1 FAD-binding oxidoreductase [Marinomonas vulgaris]